MENYPGAHSEGSQICLDAAPPGGGNKWCRADRSRARNLRSTAPYVKMDNHPELSVQIRVDINLSCEWVCDDYLIIQGRTLLILSKNFVKNFVIIKWVLSLHLSWSRDRAIPTAKFMCLRLIVSHLYYNLWMVRLPYLSWNPFPDWVLGGVIGPIIEFFFLLP